MNGSELGVYIAKSIAWHDEQRDVCAKCENAHGFDFHQGAACALWNLGVKFSALAEYNAAVRDSKKEAP